MAAVLHKTLFGEGTEATHRTGRLLVRKGTTGARRLPREGALPNRQRLPSLRMGVAGLHRFHGWHTSASTRNGVPDLPPLPEPRDGSPPIQRSFVDHNLESKNGR